MPEPKQIPIKLSVQMNVPTRRPAVIFEFGQLTAPLSVETAHRLGQQLIDIAIEAEIRGFLLDWMTQHFGQFTVEQASALAMQFRQYLAQRRGAGRGPAGPRPEGGGPAPGEDAPPPSDRR